MSLCARWQYIHNSRYVRDSWGLWLKVCTQVYTPPLWPAWTPRAPATCVNNLGPDIYFFVLLLGSPVDSVGTGRGPSGLCQRPWGSGSRDEPDGEGLGVLLSTAVGPVAWGRLGVIDQFAV